MAKKAEEYGYAYGTVKRAREDLNKDGVTENYYLGVKGKRGRVCFVRIKQEDPQAFEELPFDEPIPFTEPSA